MGTVFLTRDRISAFFQELAYQFRGAGRIYVYGLSSLVLHGHRPWCPELEFTARIGDEDRPGFQKLVEQLAQQQQVRYFEEDPAGVIPLPEGYLQRAIPIRDLPLPHRRMGPAPRLQFFHFDPYSVAFRFLARGDEQDYELVLELLTHGWIKFEMMENLLQEVLPRFDRKSIQQDPAEFRRKYHGLCQMWRASSGYRATGQVSAAQKSDRFLPG